MMDIDEQIEEEVLLSFVEGGFSATRLRYSSQVSE